MHCWVFYWNILAMLTTSFEDEDNCEGAPKSYEAYYSVAHT